jgi:hypothetical protein
MTSRKQERSQLYRLRRGEEGEKKGMIKKKKTTELERCIVTVNVMVGDVRQSRDE